MNRYILAHRIIGLVLIREFFLLYGFKSQSWKALDVSVSLLYSRVLKYRVARLAAKFLRPHYAQISREEQLLFTVASWVKRLVGSERPFEIRFEESDLIRRIGTSHESVIIVSPHFPIPVVGMAIMSEGFEKKLVTLAWNPDATRSSYREYVPRWEHVDFIKSDRNCFLELKQRLSEGVLAIMNPDNRSGEVPYCDLVQNGIFRFSDMISVTLVFSKPIVSKDGTITIKLKECAGVSSGGSKAESFIKFQSPERNFKLVS